LDLEGFLGFVSQGKKKIVLDLQGLGDAQLVALTGQNGSGKTTIMDNMHPFRVMPSRWKSPTPGGGSYWDQVQIGDARKVLDFEHQGATYRSLLTFRSTAKTKKAEAYLLKRDGVDVWTPVCAEDGTPSDGKTDTYDAALESILGTPEVFFHSVFSAQSRTPLSDMSAGEVKALLSGMLGHDALREQSAKVAEVASLLKAALSTLQASARTQATDADAERQATERLTQLTAQLACADAEIVQRDAEVGKLSDALTQVQVKASGEQALITQRKVLTERIEQTRVDAEAAVKQAEQAGSSVLRALQDRQAKEGSVLATLRGDLDRVAAQIKQSDTRLSQEAAIRQAVLDVAALDREIAMLTGKKGELDATLKAGQAANAALAEISRKLGSAQSAGKALAERVQQVRETSAVMERVPCGGTDLQRHCPLLEKAREAQTGLGPLEVQLHDMRVAYSATTQQGADAAAIAEKGRAAQTESNALQSQIDDLSKRRQASAALSAQLAGLDRERQVRQEAAERMAQMQAAFDVASKALVSLQEEITREIGAHAKAVSDLRAQFDERLRSARMALAELPEPQAAQALQKADADLAQARQLLVIAKTTRERVATQVATAQADAAKAAAKAQESAKAAGRAQALSDEIAHWTLLSKALGNDGLIALSIDDAGPEIAARCNALLNECYGGRFNVTIETQKTTASGGTRETLEIWVEDAIRGDRKPLDVLSGGEGVWVNESLVRGLALYIASRSGNSYATLFTDEADGALDPDRKRQFMRMKRTVLQQGGFEREYFISHTPDLLEMADARIDIASL
jgi:exonuclease SbcC